MSHRETYQGFIKELKDNEIFVFGSNPEGRHGAGTAKLAATKFGAKYGQGRGLQGQSYGLITKNLKKGFFEKERNLLYVNAGMRSIDKNMMIQNIKELYQTAKQMNDKKFLVAYTARGQNLNGYSSQEMANFFKEASSKIPSNVIFEKEFNDLVFNN